MMDRIRRSHTTILVCLVFILNMLCSCYSDDKGGKFNAIIQQQDSISEAKQDSLDFVCTHHYSVNYNFIVSSDTLHLFNQQPEEIVSRTTAVDNGLPATELQAADSTIISYGERLVVAEIRIIPHDSIDSVWVQVARDQMTFGWIHESELLPQVVPDDPISQFISVFSDTHLIWMIIIVVLIVVVYVLRIIRKKGAKIVHFNDIPSFYPTVLVLVVATAATLYASIQVFAPEMWRHFYYHPTLNPFSVPTLLCAFLSLVWLIPIVGVATIDEVRRHLNYKDMALYLGGLAAVCMVDYIVFSVTTLYFVGYVLLVVYYYYSITTFNKHRRLVYYCGRCGKAIHRKGRCPHCGVINE